MPWNLRFLPLPPAAFTFFLTDFLTFLDDFFGVTVVLYLCAASSPANRLKPDLLWSPCCKILSSVLASQSRSSPVAGHEQVHFLRIASGNSSQPKQ